MYHNLAGEGGINASSNGELSISVPREGISVWREEVDYEYCQLKKMHNLKFENYVLFGRQNQGLKPGTQPLRELWGLLQRGEGRARICRSFCNKDQVVRTSKDYCELKKTRHLRNLALFLCMGRCKSLGSVKSFLWYAP